MGPFKKRKQTITLLLIMGLALSTGSSCSTSAAAKEKRPDFKEINEADFENLYECADYEPLVKAASINLEGILLGQLALEKGTNTNIKDLGSMLIQANEKGLKEVTALAVRKSIALPATITDRGQNSYKKLDAIAAKSFDQAYSDMTVSHQREAIQYFDSLYNRCTDTEISRWALAALPLLRNQLDETITCQMKNKK